MPYLQDHRLSQETQIRSEVTTSARVRIYSGVGDSVSGGVSVLVSDGGSGDVSVGGNTSVGGSATFSNSVNKSSANHPE